MCIRPSSCIRWHLFLLTMQAARARTHSFAFLSTPFLRPASVFSPTPPRCLVRETKPRPRTCTTMTVAKQAPITGPKWVLDYPSLDSPEMLADLEAGTAMVARIEEMSGPVKDAIASAPTMSLSDAEPVLKVVREMFDELWASVRLLGNVSVMVSCFASVQGTDAHAKKLSGRMSELRARRSAAYEPASLFLVLCTDEVADAFVASSDSTRAAAFSVEHARKMRAHKLSLGEEGVASALGVTGHSAWGSLYKDLSASLQATVEREGKPPKTMGVAAAQSLRDSPEEDVRKAAWRAVRDAWRPHKETCAATLNAITGWRHAVSDKRGHPSYLTPTLHDNRMKAKSLEAIFDAIEDDLSVGRRALAVKAAALGKEKVDVWDMYAPPPKELAVDGDVEPKLYTFDEAIELIARSVSEVDEQAGAFVRMMRDKEFIEGSEGDNKMDGAFCIQFPKSGTPRVYMANYNGRSSQIITLAHELGVSFLLPHCAQPRENAI